MRWMRYFLPLLLLISVSAPGLQQYSEGACILLDQQVERFSHMPQSSSYRNAKSEYDKKCRKPTRAVPPETEARRDTTPIRPAPREPDPVVVEPAEPAATKPEVSATETTASETTEPATTKPEIREVDTSQVAKSLATPAAVAEQLLQAKPATDQPVDAEKRLVAEGELADTMLPVPVVVPADAEPMVGDWWQWDNLLNSILTNLPLIIANIFAFLLAVFLLTNWLGLNLPGFKGVFAEYKLNRLLRWRLARGYRHFRKLKLLTAKEELVVVDHLVLSPFGIFVIMVKGYRGNIYGNVAEANWMRQYFGSKKQFMNPLHQNFKHVEAIKHHLQLQGTDLAQHVHSVVAFSRVAQFKTDMPANVTYVDTAPAYLKKFDEPCFDDEQLNRFAALLRQASTAN
ncbi:Nuclease-related domain-containing protein [Arsukibacterium tuosuense]|uniref:Nuclease-related domain-containing protein n=1 Tax=Arsukibacterium tuosuense TaxID=1323745 RepID=A0A285JJH5_9GAMM|nr:nuclease-related domain-containing protein [Arsukibacterium tuosuense]SNY60449.1 Nuclease-related domain-containing protein [Arsukibacterium tuosuense]